MFPRWFLCLALVTACKSSTAPDPTSTGSATPVVTAKKAGCAFLSEATVKEVTGVAVTTHEHGNPQSCALFKTPAGKDYLLVSTASASAYPMFLESWKPEMFPHRTSVPGVGTEALLLRWNDDPGASRVLIARNAERTVVLTPMPAAAPITDAQLVELARRAVAP